MHSQSPSALTVGEFCQKWQIDRSTYYRNCKTGQMPPAIKIGGSTRILVADEQAWLDALRSEQYLPAGQASANPMAHTQGGDI